MSTNRPIRSITDIDELIARTNKLLPSKKRGRKKRKPTGKNGAGYEYIYVNGKSVLKHRVLKSKALKRALHDYESVFFKDGDRTNFSDDNLKLGLKPGRGLEEVICAHCNQPVG